MYWKRHWKGLAATVMALCALQPALAAILSIPFFSQRDSRWNMPTGCATTSMAMALAYRGSGADPGRLDAWLKKNAGYDSNGLLRWDVAAKYNGTQWLTYDGRSTLPDLKTLSSQLDKGKLIIAESKRFPSHFVIIRGVTPDNTVGYYWDPWDANATQRRIGDGFVNVGAGTRVFSRP